MFDVLASRVTTTRRWSYLACIPWSRETTSAGSVAGRSLSAVGLDGREVVGGASRVLLSEECEGSDGAIVGPYGNAIGGRGGKIGRQRLAVLEQDAGT